MTQQELQELLTVAINAIDKYRDIDPYFNDASCETPWEEKPIHYRLCYVTLGLNAMEYHNILSNVLDDTLSEHDLTQTAGYLWERFVSGANLMRRNNADLKELLTSRYTGLETATKELENAISEIEKRILIVDSYGFKNERY